MESESEEEMGASTSGQLPMTIEFVNVRSDLSEVEDNLVEGEDPLNVISEVKKEDSIEDKTPFEFVYVKNEVLSEAEDNFEEGGHSFIVEREIKMEKEAVEGEEMSKSREELPPNEHLDLSNDKNMKGKCDKPRNKMHICEFCKKIFNRAYNLQRHLRIHTGEKDYFCQFCNKRFSRNYHLKRHIRTHTGDRPYVCNYCNKTFTDSSHLRKHVLIHTAGKPFICRNCSKGFNSNTKLKGHYLRVHGGQSKIKIEFMLH